MSSRSLSPSTLPGSTSGLGADPATALEAASWALAAMIGTMRKALTAPLTDVLASAPQSVIVQKRMGGATARMPADATPFWYRQARHNLDIHAQWAPGSPPEPHIAWARAARQAARRDSAGAGYVNFIGADADYERVGAAYGGNYSRLARIKTAYAPDNFVHLNNKIPSAIAAGNGDQDGRRCHLMMCAGRNVHTCQRLGPPGAGS